jgi:hypothetical protein
MLYTRAFYQCKIDLFIVWSTKILSSFKESRFDFQPYQRTLFFHCERFKSKKWKLTSLQKKHAEFKKFENFSTFFRWKSGHGLKGTLAWDFFVLVFCTYQTQIGQIISLLNFFDFVLEFADLFEFFTFCGDSVDAESHFSSTESTQVRLRVNWVNAEWDSMSTESTRIEKSS